MQRAKIAEFVTNNRMPAPGGWGDWAKDGLLLTYGPNTDDAIPSDLPMERPTRFELVINMKTAKALGVNFPASLLARADEVIE
jgi:putative tryptophan/tyrosine transport system substrate-binding protein